MKPCLCHPENEDLIEKLSGKVKLSYDEMLRRTIVHACWLLTDEEGVEISPRHLHIHAWTQYIYQHSDEKEHYAFFIVVSYGDEQQQVFVSINGCIPKHLSYPGPLFWSAVNDRQLSGDFNNEEYWKAIQVDEY